MTDEVVLYAVLRHPDFDRDLRKQIAWWTARNPARALAILDALESAARSLSELPELGRPAEIGGVWSMTTRTWPVGETGLVLRYKLDKERERIILTRLRHEKQRPLRRL